MCLLSVVEPYCASSKKCSGNNEITPSWSRTSPENIWRCVRAMKTSKVAKQDYSLNPEKQIDIVSEDTDGVDLTTRLPSMLEEEGVLLGKA